MSAPAPVPTAPAPDMVELVKAAIARVPTGYRGNTVLSWFPDETLERIAIAALAAIPAPDAATNAPRMSWVVTEPASHSSRRHDRLEDALATAATWVSQSVGDVVISRREVSP